MYLPFLKYLIPPVLSLYQPLIVVFFFVVVDVVFFVDVVAALAVGLPVFAYGSVLNSGQYKTLGSLLTVLLSGIIALAASGKERRYAR